MYEDMFNAMFNKYKTFSVLIYSYINTSGNWENEELCSSFPNFHEGWVTVYQYGKNVLYLFYNIAQRNIKKEIFRRFLVDIELYQHGPWSISVQNLQMLYYKMIYYIVESEILKISITWLFPICFWAWNFNYIINRTLHRGLKMTFILSC
jgi:hypothetical protein